MKPLKCILRGHIGSARAVITYELREYQFPQESYSLIKIVDNLEDTVYNQLNKSVQKKVESKQENL